MFLTIKLQYLIFLILKFQVFYFSFFFNLLETKNIKKNMMNPDYILFLIQYNNVIYLFYKYIL